MSISQPCCLTHKHWTMTMAYSVSMQQVAKVLKGLAVTTHPDQKKDLVQYLGQSTLRCLSHHWRSCSWRRHWDGSSGRKCHTGFQWIPMDWAWVIFRRKCGTTAWIRIFPWSMLSYEKTVSKDRPSPTLSFSLSILATCPMGWWSQKTRKRGFLFVNVHHIGRPSTTSSVKPTPSAPGRPVMSCNAFRPCRPQIRTERSHLHMSDEEKWDEMALFSPFTHWDKPKWLVFLSTPTFEDQRETDIRTCPCKTWQLSYTQKSWPRNAKGRWIHISAPATCYVPGHPCTKRLSQ